MSNNLNEKESQLCDAIRQQFRKEGLFDEIKCKLQHKIVEMMRGGGDAACQSKRHSSKQDTRTLLLNMLIMEYLRWHEFNYSAEMLATETGMVNCNPNRELLEKALGKFQEKEIPVLLEIVLNLWKNNKKEDGDLNKY